MNSPISGYPVPPLDGPPQDIRYAPLALPRCSRARLAMTSLAYMFVEVPAPP